jgi:hypothetical protein
MVEVGGQAVGQPRPGMREVRQHAADRRGPVGSVPAQVALAERGVERELRRHRVAGGLAGVQVEDVPRPERVPALARQVLAQPADRRVRIAERAAVLVQDPVEAADLVVQEARRTGERDGQRRRGLPDQPVGRAQLGDPLVHREPGHLRRRVLVADRMPGGAGGLQRHQVQPAAGQMRGPAGLRGGQPGVVAVQDRAPVRHDEKCRVMAHRRELRNDRHPGAAVVQRELLPGRYLDDPSGTGGRGHPFSERGPGIARNEDAGPRGEPVDEPGIEMIEMLVRNGGPVGTGRQRAGIQMIVSRVLVPGPEEGARRSEPGVREQAERGRVHRHPRMSEKSDRGHAATVSPGPLGRTRRNAQDGYAVGMKEMPGRPITIPLGTPF